MVNGRVNGRVLQTKAQRKKIDYKKATKKKIKISLDRNLMSRPNKIKIQPKQ